VNGRKPGHNILRHPFQQELVGVRIGGGAIAAPNQQPAVKDVWGVVHGATLVRHPAPINVGADVSIIRVLCYRARSGSGSVRCVVPCRMPRRVG
jgi:hypothetical protein